MEEIKIGISNRHVHLKREDLDILFGKGYELTCFRPLSQPGQYACNEKVTIKTAKNSFENVRVLGPVRSYTQVEISKTDSFVLGLNPPVRDSGDIKGSESITIVGSMGEVTIKEGCIIATRHIHATKEDIDRLGLVGVDKVDVMIPGDKGGILYNVSIKVDPSFSLEMHLDTDDGNGHLITNDTKAIILKKEHE